MKSNKSGIRTTAAALLLVATQMQAGLINVGFETGNYAGSTTIGSNSVIGSLGPVSPPEGSFQPFSSTGDGAVSEAALEAFLGLSPGTLDGLGNGDVTSGSAIQQTFTLPAAETLEFFFNFLTNEGTPSFLTISRSPCFKAALSN